VIVRIATEGQYELADEDVVGLNELDNDAVAACDGDDEPAFEEIYHRLVAYVRSHGHRIDEDELIGSDIILPPPDVSIDEARKEFRGEGLIPG
jgi:PspA-Associated protein